MGAVKTKNRQAGEETKLDLLIIAQFYCPLPNGGLPFCIYSKQILVCAHTLNQQSDSDSM